jgi:hypothetical protein
VSFQFTQVGADSFQRADESPLNPTNWTNLFGGADCLEIVSDTCVIALTADQDGGGQFLATPGLGPDQYAELSIKDLTADGGGSVYLRWAPGGTFNDNLATYRFSISGPFNDSSVSVFSVDETNANGSGIVYTWIPDPGVAVTIAPNDVFSFGVIGTKASGGQLYVFQNRELIWMGNLADDPTAGLTSGVTGIQLFSSAETQGQFDIGVVNFACGQISQSGGGSAPPWLADQNSQFDAPKRHRGF